MRVLRSQSLSGPASTPRAQFGGLFRTQSSPSQARDPTFTTNPHASTHLAKPSIKRSTSALARARYWVSSLHPRKFKQDYYRNQAAQTCYECLVETFHCEDENLISLSRDLAPLFQFISLLLDFVGAESAFVETIILLLHRFGIMLTEEMINTRMISGHLIFLSTFVTSAQIHLERGGSEWRLEDLVDVSKHAVEALLRMRQLFENKVVNLRPISIAEEQVLVPIFREFRVPTDDAEWPPVSPIRTCSKRPTL